MFEKLFFGVFEMNCNLNTNNKMMKIMADESNVYKFFF